MAPTTASQPPQPASILITQCLQRDFMEVSDDHVQNQLHIGQAEARRLLGGDGVSGPLAQLLRYLRLHTAPTERRDDDAAADGDGRGFLRRKVYVVHCLDWHDENDPNQTEHLQTFGPHCIVDTEGAECVLGLQRAGDEWRDGMQRANRLFFCRGQGLDDLHDVTQPSLPAIIDYVMGMHQELRVGVIGVWTDVKVSLLIRSISARYGLDATQLATCDALCSSPLLTNHYLALSSLSDSGVCDVLPAVEDFAYWLGGGEQPVFDPVALSTGMHDVVSAAMGQTAARLKAAGNVARGKKAKKSERAAGDGEGAAGDAAGDTAAGDAETAV